MGATAKQQAKNRDLRNQVIDRESGHECPVQVDVDHE